MRRVQLAKPSVGGREVRASAVIGESQPASTMCGFSLTSSCRPAAPPPARQRVSRPRHWREE